MIRISCPTCQLIQGILLGRGVPSPVANVAGKVIGLPLEEFVVEPAIAAVKKRIPTKYQKLYGRLYREMKKSHPTYQHRRLVKAAHKEAKSRLGVAKRRRVRR